jgi:hypothetical protein
MCSSRLPHCVSIAVDLIYSPYTASKSHRTFLYLPLLGEAPAPLACSVGTPDCSPESAAIQTTLPKAGKAGKSRLLQQRPKGPDPQRKSRPSSLSLFTLLERASLQLLRADRWRCAVVVLSVPRWMYPQIPETEHSEQRSHRREGRRLHLGDP